MIILTLDLGTRMGIARGAPGAPEPSFLLLRKPNDGREIAYKRLIGFLNKAIADVDLVFKEAMMPLAGMRDKSTSAKGVEVTMGYHAIVEGMCARRGVRLEERHPSTVRKHFIGVGRGTSRAATKRAVIKRCHLIGTLPATCFDDDQADALALHDYASVHFAGRVPELHLFEQPEKRRSKHGMDRGKD